MFLEGEKEEMSKKKKHRTKHRTKPICIIMCEKEKRPELKWHGFGKVPDYALPSTESEPNYGVIPVKITTPYRETLETVYLTMHGIDILFTGVVKVIKGNNIIFDRITFVDDSDYANISDEYMEEHVWVRNIPLDKMPKDIKVGDTISFFGKVFLYRRMNGTLDYGIEDFDYIEKCSNRVIPSKEELDEQHRMRFLNQLCCEVCLYNEQCDRLNCLL